MKAKELREKTLDDLKKMLIDLLQNQFNLRMQKGIGNKVNTNSFSEVRRNIALIKTLIHEKGLMNI